MDRLRIGTLGAAWITPRALIEPAHQVQEAVVTAVAASTRDRARAFAAENAVPEVHDSYEALIADPEIDAIYNPLPNSLHALWTLKAIEAGKHVLCEKPFTSNAAEAETVAAAAKKSGLVVMEAFHYRYHPLADRVCEIVHGADGRGGELGAIGHIEASLWFPTAQASNIRYSYELAGGATMDAGCYGISFLRLLGPAEPEVVSAQAELQSPGVDAAMTAGFFYPGGATGRFDVSLQPGRPYAADVQITGDHGFLRVENFMLPHSGHHLEVMVRGQERREEVPGETTYTYQLRAFTAAVLHGESYPTTAQDAVINMRLIDDVYRAAGLPLRGT
ncbi:MAG: Gfo/Idh/MocA family protein [Micromonosporaceae bacterium]